MRQPHHLVSIFVSALFNIPRFDIVEGLGIAIPAVWLLRRLLTAEPKVSTSVTERNRLQSFTSNPWVDI
jgi:hypothetical protein